MSTQVQLRRGTTTQHSTFTGAVGEVTFDTDKNTLIVHDGSTTGGHELAKSGVAGSFTTGAFSSDVTITGDLTVNGTTTTVNSNTVEIGDNIIVLNSDETGTPSQNAGIEIERGTSTNRSVIWNETTNKWTLTNDGSSYSNILIASEIGVSVQGYDADTVISDTASTFSADQNFADGVKATFGNASDLMIYHDGSRSIIQDQGLGNLRIQAANLELNSWDNAESYIFCQDNGAVTLYYDNAPKVATSATGVDVTGNVLVSQSGANSSITINRTDEAPQYNLTMGQSGSSPYITGNDAQVFHINVDPDNTQSSSAFNLNIDGNIALKANAGGDISFYDSAGSNAKFFWDATDSHLGINDTTPENMLTVVEDQDNIAVIKARTTTTDGRASYQIGNDAQNWFMGIDGGRSDSFFIANAVGSSDKFLISQAGNINIGDNIVTYNNPNLQIRSEDDTAISAADLWSALNKPGIDIRNSSNTQFSYAGINFFGGTSSNSYAGINMVQTTANSKGALTFWTGGDGEGAPYAYERTRIDSAGNFLVGKTSTGSTVRGSELRDGTAGYIATFSTDADGLSINRTSTAGYGDFVLFRYNGQNTGRINTRASFLGIGSGDTGLEFHQNDNTIYPYAPSTKTLPNGTLSLGSASYKFKDAHFSGTLRAARGVGNTWTGSLSSGALLNYSVYTNWIITMTGNLTLTNPTTEIVGQSGFIIFKQDGTGGRTVSLGSEYLTAGGAGLTLSSAANAIDMVPYVVIASGQILLGTPQLAFA